MTDDEPRLILMHPALVPAFEEWLASRRLQCLSIGRGHTSDDPELWMVSPTDEAMRRLDALERARHLEELADG